MPTQGMPLSPTGGTPASIPIFKFYCQTVLPAVFDDSLSYYEAVCKVSEKLNEVINQSNTQTNAIEELQLAIKELQEFPTRIQEEVDKQGRDISALQTLTNELQVFADGLQEQFTAFKEHGFDDYYREQVIAWIDEHLKWVFTAVAKQIFFGLSEDGHFCAYIPDSWQDITFDTGAVYGRSDYGRLILRFTADNAIDNTYSYSIAEPTDMEKLQADIEVVNKQVFTNMDEVVQ